MNNTETQQTWQQVDPEQPEAVEQFVQQATPEEVAAFINENWDSFQKERRNFFERIFRHLNIRKIVQVFENLHFSVQSAVLETFGREQIRYILNELSPDDRTRLFSKIPSALLNEWLPLLTKEERQETLKLLAYEEESIGRLMTTDFIAVQANWTCEEAIAHIRRYGEDSETINIIYVVDADYRLIDDLKIREVLLAEPSHRIDDIADYRFVQLDAELDQEKAIRVFKETDRYALPVTDHTGTLLGIVTVDDLLDIMELEDTEDIHKLGGSMALHQPYFAVHILELIKKRAGWLIVLFFGLMLTASAMTYYEGAIADAVVLSLFIPMIIASGGNSGSQAATIITRSLALDQVLVKDWWRVLQREFLSGIMLGLILGLLGFLRVFLGDKLGSSYGEHALLLALTIGVALVGVVLWGTLMGSLLPLLLKRLGFDPAVSSVPVVSSLVDVTGIVIYFTIAYAFLQNTLL